MKKAKKVVIFTLGLFILTLGSYTALAASPYSTPAEIVAKLTNRDVESVVDERVETGKTYGTIAKEAYVLDEFKDEVLEMKKDVLSSRVEEGSISQEQADAVIDRMESNQEICDGSGLGYGQRGEGQGLGAGLGWGNRQDSNKAGYGRRGMCAEGPGRGAGSRFNGR